MRSRLIFGLYIGLALSLAGCNQSKKDQDQEQDGFSTDLITNPVSATGQPDKNSELPVIEFKKTKHDFGLIVQGEKVAHSFRFTNTGGANLVISNVSSTCGCTVPDFSKKPIKPGDEGTIEVVFNSAGRNGSQSKSVSVLSNAQPNTVQLEITAEIYIPDKN